MPVEIDDEGRAADHEFVEQCTNCLETHEDCTCEEFEPDDWCAECGELEDDPSHIEKNDEDEQIRC